MVISHAPSPVEFLSVTTLDDALDQLSEIGSECTVLAGGTDLMVQLIRGEIEPTTLLYVGQVDELKGFDHDGSVSRMGTLATHRNICSDQVFAGRFPALVEASQTVGGWQTQEVGTIGGNICNASPAADTVAPLLVADAVISLASKSDRRSVGIADFITDRRRTIRRPDELLTHIDLTACTPGTGEVYLKVAPRTAMEVAVVGLAVRLTVADGVATSVRIAVTAAAPVPFRATAAEQVLENSRLAPEDVADAALLVVRASSPIDDHRASAAYRRAVLERLLGRAIDIAYGRAMS